MRILFVLLLLAFTGCSSTTATKNVADSVIESIESIEKTLPKECKTESVMAQINGAKAQIPNIVKVCETELREQEQITEKWTLASIFEFGIIALLVYILFKRGLK